MHKITLNEKQLEVAQSVEDERRGIGLLTIFALKFYTLKIEHGGTLTRDDLPTLPQLDAVEARYNELAEISGNLLQ